jgi:hypothetical protein
MTTVPLLPLHYSSVLCNQDFLSQENTVLSQTLIGRKHILVGWKLVQKPDVQSFLLCLAQCAYLSGRNELHLVFASLMTATSAHFERC